MKLLKEYFELQAKIYEYFGYSEDWKVIPLDDATEFHWYVIEDEHGGGEVHFSDDVEKLKDIDTGEYFANEIYTQRFLPKWVYRGEEYTMICVDTHTDGNKFLQGFDNKKEFLPSYN